MANEHMQPFHDNLLKHRENHAPRWRGGALFAREHVAPESLWFDFLLDLALAASYSNLANNAHDLSDINTLSYIAFFFLLWWIWTSQVAYNIRFRKNDWIHRLYLLLQLFQFGALATFTSYFNIAQDLIEEEKFFERFGSLEEAGFTSPEIDAKDSRRSHLPFLNDRGFVLTMGASRLLLLLQYAITWYHTKKSQGRYSLLPIIISLILSSTMYFITPRIPPDYGWSEAVAKVCLWYSAIIVEIIALYIDIAFKSGQDYPKGTALVDRFSILMTVIVGEGVNQTTGTLHYLIGNIGFNADTVLDMVSVGLIIFATFILYFEGWCWLTPSESGSTPTLGNDESRLKTNFRPLTWVITHILYFCCLILFMRSLKSVLAFQNMTTAIHFLHKDMKILPNFVDQPHMPWDDSRLNTSLRSLGLPWDTWKGRFSNESLSKEVRLNISYWWSGHVYLHLASLFEALPDPDSMESAVIQAFESKGQASKDEYVNILRVAFTPLARSTLWLAGPAGGTLIALAILNVIQRSPPDKYAWLSVISRFLVGSVVTSLAVLDKGTENYMVFQEDQSLVWKFLNSGSLLSSLALVFIIQVVIDYILIYGALFNYRPQIGGSAVAHSDDGRQDTYLLMPLLPDASINTTSQITPHSQTPSPADVDMPATTIEMPTPEPFRS